MARAACGRRRRPKLEEPLIVRPTSETIIGATFARWVQSYRDLPILINQWANVVRWELRTRLFLRTTEFLWQEGHTVHATEAEAREETMRMLDVYADFAEHTMAMPVIKGEKTAGERFPGAVEHVHDRSDDAGPQGAAGGHVALLGQNFAKAQEIKFQDENGQQEYRVDDVVGRDDAARRRADHDARRRRRPRAAAEAGAGARRDPADLSQRRRAGEVLPYCATLEQELAAQSYAGEPVRVRIDNRDIRGGEKKWQWVKRGVPVRVEIGPRDVANNGVFVARRDSAEKGMSWPRERVHRKASPRHWLECSRHCSTGPASSARRPRCESTSLKEFEAFFTPEERRAAGNPRRPGVFPLRRIARDGRKAEGAQSDGSLRAAATATTSPANASSRASRASAAACSRRRISRTRNRQ